jgi:hypothetical protein
MDKYNLTDKIQDYNTFVMIACFGVIFYAFRETEKGKATLKYTFSKYVDLKSSVLSDEITNSSGHWAYSEEFDSFELAFESMKMRVYDRLQRIENELQGFK